MESCWPLEPGNNLQTEQMELNGLAGSQDDSVILAALLEQESGMEPDTFPIIGKPWSELRDPCGPRGHGQGTPEGRCVSMTGPAWQEH